MTQKSFTKNAIPVRKYTPTGIVCSKTGILGQPQIIIFSSLTSVTAHFTGHLFTKTKIFTYFYTIMVNHERTTLL